MELFGSYSRTCVRRYVVHATREKRLGPIRMHVRAARARCEPENWASKSQRFVCPPPRRAGRRVAAMPPKGNLVRTGKDDGQSEERLTRIAVISADRCRPKKCKQECKKSCPVVKIGEPKYSCSLPCSSPAGAGKLCIEVNPGSKIAWLSEELCIGCGICVKVRRRLGLMTDAALTPHQKCPFEAIMIINLPKDLDKDTTHRYGPNSFKLHRRGDSRGEPPPRSHVPWPGFRRRARARSWGWWGRTALASPPRSRSWPAS